VHEADNTILHLSARSPQLPSPCNPFLSGGTIVFSKGDACPLHGGRICEAFVEIRKDFVIDFFTCHSPYSVQKVIIKQGGSANINITNGKPLNVHDAASKRRNNLSAMFYHISQAIVTYNCISHDPIQVLEVFDAYLYFLKWEARRLAVSFPNGLIDVVSLSITAMNTTSISKPS
jgi:hypothetical protein